MLYICHRINTAAGLKALPEGCGAELDLRDRERGGLYLSHEPFAGGEDFEKYLEAYRSGMLIVNVKSERIEEEAVRLLDKYGVKSYFFLDSSFPMIYLLSRKGIRDTAVRFSEFEGLDTLRAMSGRANWVWADCFTKMPLTRENYAEIKSLGYRICTVSPELQGQPEKLEEYGAYLSENGIVPDAVCTKLHCIDRWKKYFGE